MKRVLIVIAAIAAVATAAVWFAAEESYVTTVKAQVGTSLNVTAHGSQNYGLVFGQEVRVGRMAVEINAKAKANSNLTGVQFTVGCNDGASGTFASSICPNLTLNPSGAVVLCVLEAAPPFNPVDDTCNGDSQSEIIQWTFVAPDCQGAAQKKPDSAKRVACSQSQNWDLSGDVFIDVDARSGTTKELVCNKKTNTFWNVNTGQDTGIACVVGGDPQPLSPPNGLSPPNSVD